jgi:hypothetical protein
MSEEKDEVILLTLSDEQVLLLSTNFHVRVTS